MAKSSKKTASRKAGKAPGAAMPRSMQNRGTADRRKAVQQPKKGARKGAVTRVTHETEVRGTETRVERVVERAPKPSLSDVDRSAGRGRYVYCIIRSSQPLKFGGIGM